MRYRVCKKSEVPENGIASFQLEGEPILIANVGGEFFAIADTCSHAEASLSEGNLEGYEVQCPMHGAYFDVRDGEALSFPAVAPVESYKVVLEGDDLYIEVPDL